MGKRYRKMTKKANGKTREINDGQVVLELPLPTERYWQGFLRQWKNYLMK